MYFKRKGPIRITEKLTRIDKQRNPHRTPIKFKKKFIIPIKNVQYFKLEYGYYHKIFKAMLQMFLINYLER